ncbi:unnamed protein product [Symbiodinium sp. CCMP2592]|nr:unnamed protein product [Symbiodinium sp. CCMP2592]
MADAWGSGLRKGFLAKSTESKKTASKKTINLGGHECANISSSQTGLTVLTFDEDFTLRSVSTTDHEGVDSASSNSEKTKPAASAKTTTKSGDFKKDFERLDIASSDTGLTIQRFEQDTDIVIKDGEIFVRPSVISEQK